MLYHYPMPLDLATPMVVDRHIEHRLDPGETARQPVRVKIAIDLGFNGVQAQLPLHGPDIIALAKRRPRGRDQGVLQKRVMALTDVEPAHQFLDLLETQAGKSLGRLRGLHILGLQGFIGLVAALDLQGHPGEMGEVEIQSTDIFQGQLGQRPLAVLVQRLARVADGGAGRAGGNDNRRD
ncbi:hypothetical protein D3C72_1613350 [compost metagenome]